MKQKLLLFALLGSSVFTLVGQNGTRPDEAKVILGSEVVRTINVIANDNAIAGKTYQLENVYKTTTKNIIVARVGTNATYQAKHSDAQNDTFYYVAREINSGSLDTNYVVIKKDVLSYDLRPGDANKDNICNNIDVLNIGIAYGKSEIPREGLFLTDSWTLVKAYDWPLTNVKSNYRFSDANGDGTIDSAGDVSTIIKNYNQSVGFQNIHYSPTGGESFQIISSDTVKTETSTSNITLSINLGSNNSKLERVYGLAFTLKYNPQIIQSYNIKFKASRWFNDNESSLNFGKVNANDGELDITIVRKSGNGGIGFGELGVIDVVIEDILQSIDMSFVITKPVLIDSVYNVLPITLPSPKPIHIVKKVSSQINHAQINSGLKYNLTNQILTLRNENSKHIEVSIVSILGKEISKRVLAPNQTIDIDTNLWPSGIYFLKTANEVFKIHLK